MVEAPGEISQPMFLSQQRSRNEFFATFGAAARQNFATVAGRHPCAETMRAFAADIAGAVCALHKNPEGRKEARILGIAHPHANSVAFLLTVKAR